jgi:NitT/TauT family transport system ATP-binding protein
MLVERASVAIPAATVERGPSPRPRPQALIVCRGLGKSYPVRIGDPVVALENLNIEIPAEEFLAVVGPSGCGKSTLLRLLAGLDRRSRGHMELGGISIDGPRKDIGVVFQTATLLAWRTVLENIMLPVDVLGLSRDAHHMRAMQLIKMAKLEGFENKYPWELSGGMQQRVAICRALINQPKLLLMDEPFGALDALTRESMNVELESIWLSTKQTILLITHSISEAVFLGSRVAVMSSRPGTISDVINIDIPRPRTLDITTSTEFVGYIRQVRAVLDGTAA